MLSGFFVGLITLNDPAFDSSLCAGRFAKALKRSVAMGITRRQFLFSIPAAGAGLILPSFFDKAVDVLARSGEPLIVPPGNVQTELYAVDEGYGEFQLNLGDPWQGPPQISLREYINDYSGMNVDEYIAEVYGEDAEVDLDEPVDVMLVIDTWARSESPNALAYHLLGGLDLGPDLSGLNAVGEIRFIDGSCPGNDYLGVHAADAISLSLLQLRLNQLDTGILIRMA
jgi:hypothetical protein